MDNSQRAWELAMVLIANGKISFDPANPEGSVEILAKHLQAMEAALQEQPLFNPNSYPSAERVAKPAHRRPALARVD
ncbi:hypothetical protein QF043_002897 [Pseudomonas sp. W3I7]|uniref:hypothetical protein n=1 Tax=Pseudomonas sp. W3I7 TaxID=3042292 RepID=UPI002792587E|nr:hypothetical protein [Pseudomonas sp. W3I7]MDQ0704105.1 hypothetical protein [Pseudomonas sp. W3I7]